MWWNSTNKESELDLNKSKPISVVGRDVILLTALAKTPMSSGNWCVSMASMAVKEQRPAVKSMKKGSSFFGYTDTSWKAGMKIKKGNEHGEQNVIMQREDKHIEVV